MSFLAPWYLLAALAFSLPVAFHLLQRRPSRERIVSSLLFFQSTPPRLSRRSRITHWWLLLLRALALILLAAAFARPFLRQTVSAPIEHITRNRVLLVDTSASMRRSGIAKQVATHLKNFLSERRPGDAISVVTFDRQPSVVMDWHAASDSQQSSQSLSRFDKLVAATEPSWEMTDLGTALVFASNHFETSVAHTADKSAPAKEIVLVSDLQAGSDLSALDTYRWPTDVTVQLQGVASDVAGNASPRLITAQEEDTTKGLPIRISNQGDSLIRDLFISLKGETKPSDRTEPRLVQVAPGSSRVIWLPLNSEETHQIELIGDGASFDNTLYHTRPPPEETHILFVGPPSDAEQLGLCHYLELAVPSNRQRSVTVDRVDINGIFGALTGERAESSAATGASGYVRTGSSRTRFVVLHAIPTVDQAQVLRSYLEQGGQVLVVIDRALSQEPGLSQILGSLTDSRDLPVSEAKVNDYAMLAKIDLRHPLLRPLADPQYSDFTKIRFWRHRMVSPPESASAIATFDSGAPWLLEYSRGAGTVWIMTSGWQPDESQFALSTKFVPVILGMLDYGEPAVPFAANRYVGDNLLASPSHAEEITSIHLPDGMEVSVAGGATSHVATVPGIYAIQARNQSWSVAVNLAPEESITERMDDTDLTERGLSLTTDDPLANVPSATQDGTDVQAFPTSDSEAKRLRGRELEKRQQGWRWLLIAALSCIGIETWLAGELTRRDQQPAADKAVPPAEGD